MDVFIGVDLGTSGIKAVLTDAAGKVLAKERRATELLRPAPGFVEFSPVRCYQLLCEVVKGLIARAPAGAGVKALSLSGATGNTVLMDGQGEPLGNAISWMDTRAERDPACDPPGISAAEIHRIVGWPWGRWFPLAHLAWLRNHERNTWERASIYAMNITYLYHRLTGKWGMDHSTATTFYLQDQENRRWHPPFLNFLGLSEKDLPLLMASGDRLGSLTAKAAAETGLPPDTVVALGAFDHPSAALGCGVLKPGDLLLSCGTSWVGFYPVTDRRVALDLNLLVDPFLSPGGPWGALFSLPRVGEGVDAFVSDRYRSEKDSASRLAAFDAEAARDKAGPAYAIMADIAQRTADRMSQLAASGLRATRIAMVGGPAHSPVWPDILRKATGLKIELPEIGSYAGALGAALLAGARKPNS